MKDFSKKLINGDFFQLFNYPVRKQIVYLYKEGKFDVLKHVLDGLVMDVQADIPLDSCFMVTIFDSDYPTLLLETYDPPLVLYCEGDRSLLQKNNKLAVIGSRNPKETSMNAVFKIIHDIKKKGGIDELVIVSGLAKGIDAMGHQLALNHNIKTIAILGFGFNYIYPAENKKLLDAIKKKGLVISEYPPHMGVNRWQFIARNRIIAGLSKVVVVIEAKEKSGSLITAELALSENREVYIVGGNSFDYAYYGSNALIQEGAKLLLDVDEIISEYKILH